MLTTEQINTIHHLHWSEHWSVRKIARHLHVGRRTISQYLVTPARRAAPRQRASKLDPFKSTIGWEELLYHVPPCNRHGYCRFFGHENRRRRNHL
jgi:hypothetical protein